MRALQVIAMSANQRKNQDNNIRSLQVADSGDMYSVFQQMHLTILSKTEIIKRSIGQ